MQKITHLFYISTEKTDDNGLLYDFDIDVLVLVASQVWYSWLVEKDRNYVSQDWKKFASLGILKLEQQNLKKKEPKEPKDIHRTPRTLETLRTDYRIYILSLASPSLPSYSVHGKYS